MAQFNGLGLNLGNLSRSRRAKTRSISPENFTGEKGKGGMSTEGPAANAARDLGQGWKVSPYVIIQPGETFTLADIEGPGAIQQIWMTLARGKWRHTILRVYWDDQEQPSVECPVGDFFACGWEKYRAGHLAGGVRQSRPRLQLLLGDAVPQARAASRWQNLARRGDRRLLPDQLHADRRAGRLRLFPRPVPPRQSAALQGGLHDPRRREGPGPLRRHLHGLGREQHRLVGRGRDQVLSSTATGSSRPSAAPAPRITSAAPTISIPARSNA